MKGSSLSEDGELLSQRSIMTPTAYGFYIVSNQYFADFPDPYLKHNKDQARPFYYCFQDAKTGLYWMIPLSSQQSKLSIARASLSSGRKDLFHLTNLNGVPGVMLIADMFPVTETYIVRAYTWNGVPVVYRNKNETRKIRTKAMRVLALLRRGITFSPTQPDVFKIESDLMNRR